MSFWDLFMPDNESLRTEMQKLRSRLATLVEINCAHINECIDSLNEIKDHEPFNKVTVDGDEDLKENTEAAAAVMRDVKAYVKSKDPSLAARLDMQVYDYVMSDEVPDKESLSTVLKFIVGPFALIPAYEQKNKLEDLIDELKNALKVLEPGFKEFDKNLIYVSIILNA